MAVDTPRRKAFSKFTLAEAYKQLGIDNLIPWEVSFTPVAPTAAFQIHMQRLQAFDLQRSEEGKKLLIDAILLEAIQGFEMLKLWKGAAFEAPFAHGTADYLMTENKGYFEAPLLCVIEAKKDDFEQGLAQCLVEMLACQWNNQELGRAFDIFGIVTNGEGWKFYRLATDNQVWETLMFSISGIEAILGQLNYVFRECTSNLEETRQGSP
jgi:hypothetical protein